MPMIAGIDVLRHFRMDAAFANTAFVMLTAKSEKTEVLEAVKAGATAYMTKPISHAMISKKIAEVAAMLKTKAKAKA